LQFEHDKIETWPLGHVRLIGFLNFVYTAVFSFYLYLLVLAF